MTLTSAPKGEEPGTGTAAAADRTRFFAVQGELFSLCCQDDGACCILDHDDVDVCPLGRSLNCCWRYDALPNWGG